MLEFNKNRTLCVVKIKNNDNINKNNKKFPSLSHYMSLSFPLLKKFLHKVFSKYKNVIGFIIVQNLSTNAN